MKKVIILLVLSALTSCNKDDSEIIPVIGKQYRIKTDYYIFNKGAARPKDPVTFRSSYTVSGTLWTICSAQRDWAGLAVKAGGGVKQDIVDGNLITLREDSLAGIYWGDTRPRDWQIPQYDLKELK